MDAVLIAAVVVVGLFGVLNLLLLLAVLRRLRDYEAKWARAGLDRLVERKSSPESGYRVADFEATALDGATVSLRDLEAPLFTGFFSTGCPSCREEVPRFIEYAAAMPGGPERKLVVVSGTVEQGADIIDAVRQVARVVVEPQDGPVTGAFGVQGSPTFVLLNQDGTVRTSAVSVRELASPQVAAR
ncbi:TlpA disulfide reductase family protein [Streptosporangium sp. NPDC051023]|uniref:TlpA family protein disulfide reductase n=1 Tax=Streptosporangium sp. NPDC051023 TaxID=3155410 RepID=UPI00344CE768